MDQVNNRAKGIFGFIFFREMPDVWSFLGYMIIIATAVVKWYYNLHVKE